MVKMGCENAKLFFPRPLSHEYWIDYLRTFACLQVVAIHTTAYQRNILELSPLYSYIRFSIEMAVPLFFLISGYVLIKRYVHGIETYCSYYRKRTCRVLWPYFTFSILYISMRIVIEYSGVYSLKTIEYIPFQFVALLKKLFFAGAAMHLYFLLSIYLIYLLFPLICWFCRNRWSSLTVLLIYSLSVPVLMSFYKSINLSLPEPDVFQSSILGMKYFLIGINLYWFESVLFTPIKKFAPLFLLGSLPIAFFLNSYSIMSNLNLSGYFLMLFYIVFAIYLGKYKSDMIRQFASFTMGIYLIHQPIPANVLNKIMVNFNFLIPWLLQFVYFVTVVIVSYLIVLFIRRHKMLYLIIFGK